MRIATDGRAASTWISSPAGVLDAGIPLTATFHRERDGSLCLWPADTGGERALVRPGASAAKVAAWLQPTEADWPGDSACDLERYLPTASGMVLYDLPSLATTHGCVQHLLLS
jgi:hypothetical protein